MTFGFIISRHVTSELTNKYWNHCIKQLNTLYPIHQIIIIDDNSNQEFVKEEDQYKNITVIQSEFPGRGELLPYYYFYKNHYFDNAVIIHDSTFFQKKCAFIKLEQSPQIKVLPLWHFDHDKYANSNNTLRIAQSLQNRAKVIELIQYNAIENPKDKWSGCFGIQSYINYNFLSSLQSKYNIFNLLNVVHCRQDRCSLERIFAVLFTIEYPEITKIKSLLGPISNKKYRWGLTYSNYILYKNRTHVPIVKVWTGR
jgi:hypothetical protein